MVAETEPLLVVQLWLNRVAASGLRRNPNSMALATVGEQGRPAVRMVLLKGIVADPGYAVFYTHYNSRKGRELEHSPTAAGALYWEEFGQQVRLEGRVLQSPPEESDAYFASRPFLSQLNAWVSAQSEPLDEPESLERRAAAMTKDFAGTDASGARMERTLPRPPFWGGYRLWCEAVELWTEGTGRFHARLRYERELTPAATSGADVAMSGANAGFTPGPWRSRRLQP